MGWGYQSKSVLNMRPHRVKQGISAMRKIISLAKQFRDEEAGAAMVEYSILIGIITAAAIAFIIGVGGYVTSAWSGLCADLGSGCVPAT